MSMTALGISAAFMIVCCFFAQIARKIIKRCISAKGLLPELINEAIAAAELCACCFELLVVEESFGISTYGVCLFLLCIWWYNAWGHTTACPYTQIEDLIEGKTSFKSAVLCTLAELLGGCCVYPMVIAYWRFELAETHKGLLDEDCIADLQVSPPMGALIEGIATLLYRLASKIICEKDPKFACILDSFVCTALVVATTPYSGGYLNPVIATALKWGCRGHSNLEHFTVYWVGTYVGGLLSVPLLHLNSVCIILLRKSKKVTITLVVQLK